MTTVRDVMTVRSSRMYTEAYPDLGSFFGSRCHPLRSPTLQWFRRRIFELEFIIFYTTPHS